ncbi:hypothetical protein GUITHDRAFT_143051 [Guillardia theta CCMP2712]|uniref:Uncharacterized protein n=1 Tax=Guillardia theta (strain CCMP2712) TaxID=905079 RepID=L1IW33_GUITC|nr:hypothetical protein GUITHDRAFT_143051 [Guillardia theta CCMP2712]EKX40104.1 hypothetical protein GUITHDRAFT_143051 [Guillardia theta CCMP2712]|eukprot:XP_005827084.1 hypothetical protein GUITHDRAFT_143051 [Guillardia theta CCMP2712]
MAITNAAIDPPAYGAVAPNMRKRDERVGGDEKARPFPTSCRESEGVGAGKSFDCLRVSNVDGCRLQAIIISGHRGSSQQLSQTAIANAPSKHQTLQEEAAPAPAPAPAAPAVAPADGGSAEATDKPSGGTGATFIDSVEKAINEKPTEQNSHYIPGHTDKVTHLMVILFLLLITVTIYYSYRSQKYLRENPRHDLTPGFESRA